MSVAAIEAAWTAWRTPGCAAACAPRRHDAEAHERYGREVALTEAASEPAAVVVSGSLEVRIGRAEVKIDGQTVPLTPTEWRILRVLALKPGHLVESDVLVREVWGADYWHSCRAAALHAIRINVLRLRNQLGPAAGLVVTLPGLGVRLEVVPAGAAPPPRPRTPGWVPTRICVACGESRRHHARGRCRPCYRRMHRAGEMGTPT